MYDKYQNCFRFALKPKMSKTYMDLCAFFNSYLILFVNR